MSTGRVRATVIRSGARLGAHELGSLVGAAVAVAGVLAFLLVADAVTDGSTQPLDEAIVLAFRNPDDLRDLVGPEWVEEVARDLTALGGVAVLLLLTLATVVYLWLTRRGRTLALLLLAVGGGIALSSVLKTAFDRPRPDVVPHVSHVVTESFPSGHSMMAAVVYLTLAALLARVHRELAIKGFLFVVAISLSVLVGVSRVMLGVHFPTDVVAGLLLGLAWAMLCWCVARLLQRRGTVEAPADPTGHRPPLVQQRRPPHPAPSSS